VYADVRKTHLTYTPAQAWCPNYWSKCMHTLSKKCICARACAHMQRCRSFFAMKLLRTYLEFCASIMQAVVTARPTAVSTKSVARRCSLKNPSKSTLAHDAAAVLHKHHSIIRVGAGPIEFVCKSHLRLAMELLSAHCRYVRLRHGHLPPRVASFCFQNFMQPIPVGFTYQLFWLQMLHGCLDAWLPRAECFAWFIILFFV